LLPEVVLIQMHTLLVFVHRLSQLLMGGPLLGHVGIAWAAFADPSSTQQRRTGQLEGPTP
jgi:hypothetical protein